MKTNNGLAVVLILSLTLGACSKSSDQSSIAKEGPTPEAAARNSADELIQRAETKVRSGVGFDPSQTQLRNVFAVEGNVVCGEIAWVDGTGKLRSFVPFMYRYGVEVKDNEDLRAARFAQVWKSLCEGRPVITGNRAPLSQHLQKDFAQRLQALAANGGKEEPEMFHKYIWRDLEQIEKDLDAAAVAQTESAAAKEDAEAQQFINQARDAANASQEK